MLPWCLLGVLTIALSPLPPVSCELIDLSYTFNDDAPNSPKLTPFRMDIVKRGVNKYGKWVSLNDLHMSEHSGTHIDAPLHFKENGWAVNEIPTSRLWRRPGVRIDLTQTINNSGNKNYAIRLEDLEAWEREHGVIPDGAVVLVRTGYDERNKTARGYKSYSGLNANNKLNFPGLSESAAEWLGEHKYVNGHEEGIVGVGIDTLSLDIGQSYTYPAHVKLFNYSIYGLENMHNLALLPNDGFYVTVLPIRLGGGSGAPARIVAETNDTITMHSMAPHANIPIALIMALLALYLMAV